MTTITTPSSLALVPSLEMAWQDVDSSFERFCLTAGIGAMEQMLCEDAQQLAGAPHNRGGGRVGHRWGRTKGKIGFHGGKVAVHRPRVRSYDGHEVALPTWRAAQAEDWLGRWAMNLMLINVSTRKLRRAVRLPEADLPGTDAPAIRPTLTVIEQRCRRAGWCHRPPAWPSFTFANGDLRADRNRGSAGPARRRGRQDDGVEEQDTAGLPAPHAGCRRADCKYVPRRHQHAPGASSTRGGVRRYGGQGHGEPGMAEGEGRLGGLERPLARRGAKRATEPRRPRGAVPPLAP